MSSPLFFFSLFYSDVFLFGTVEKELVENKQLK